MESLFIDFEWLCPADLLIVFRLLVQQQKYAEAIKLLEGGGFVNVQIHHRHGYSWTVIGTKP